MTKAELVAEIQNNLGDASKADAEKALSAVLSSIKTAVKKAGKTVKISDKEAKPAVAVQLVGFGTFSVTRRNARSGINPLTKAPLKIKASKAVKFKVGAGLKDQL
ncbi:MAG: HU family DNA-binding protein [Opitutaceae bacterium]|jgi:DNA-binding protein HU-beta|nr:HU family DNA-binding protein [Opitutaceae bacterium]|tara:strand:+ start:6051 stop:6365 length:315 start_codon:yes stop_codon:yes gene_type:complete